MVETDDDLYSRENINELIQTNSIKSNRPSSERDKKINAKERDLLASSVFL